MIWWNRKQLARTLFTSSSGAELLGSDTNFAAVRSTAPSGRAEGSANLGSDPKNSELEIFEVVAKVFTHFWVLQGQLNRCLQKAGLAAAVVALALVLEGIHGFFL